MQNVWRLFLLNFAGRDRRAQRPRRDGERRPRDEAEGEGPAARERRRPLRVEGRGRRIHRQRRRDPARRQEHLFKAFFKKTFDMIKCFLHKLHI